MITVQSCSYDASPICPASDLFHSSLVHQVVTDNLMSVGSAVLEPEDRGFVESFVAVGFANVSRRLHWLAPELASELDMIQLDKELRNAVVQTMRLVSDPRLQDIGHTVAVAVRTSPSSDREELSRFVEQRLAHRLPEIRSLRRELTPEGLRQVWGQGRHWSLTLNAADLAVLRGAGREGPATATAWEQEMYGTRDEKVYGCLGGVLEQARALIDAIRLCTRLFGEDLRVPESASQLVNGKDVLDNNRLLASCELGVGASDGSKAQLARELYCPLRYGSQGLDALRALGGAA